MADDYVLRELSEEPVVDYANATSLLGLGPDGLGGVDIKRVEKPDLQSIQDKANIIKNDGDGDMYLADNGEYKPISGQSGNFVINGTNEINVSIGVEGNQSTSMIYKEGDNQNQVDVNSSGINIASSYQHVRIQSDEGAVSISAPDINIDGDHILFNGKPQVTEEDLQWHVDHVLYVDNSYDGDDEQGTVYQPFKTIQAAIDFIGDNLSYLVEIAPGTYNENLVIDNNQHNLSISGLDGEFGQYRTVVNGSLTLSDALRIQVSNLSFYGTITIENTNLYYFNNVNTNGKTTVSGPQSNYGRFDRCFFNGVDINSSFSDIRDSQEESSKVWQTTSETARLQIFNSTQFVGQHTGGILLLDGYSLVYSNVAGRSIFSNAPATPGNTNLLILLGGCTLNANGTYGTIHKTGDCPYILQDAFEYNIGDSILSGTNIYEAYSTRSKVFGLLQTTSILTNNVNTLQAAVTDTKKFVEVPSKFVNSLTGITYEDLEILLDREASGYLPYANGVNFKNYNIVSNTPPTIVLNYAYDYIQNESGNVSIRGNIVEVLANGPGITPIIRSYPTITPITYGDGDQYLGGDGNYHNLPSSGDYLPISGGILSGSLVVESILQVEQAITGGSTITAASGFQGTLYTGLIRNRNQSTQLLIEDTYQKDIKINTTGSGKLLYNDKDVPTADGPINLVTTANGSSYLSDNGTYQQLNFGYDGELGWNGSTKQLSFTLEGIEVVISRISLETAQVVMLSPIPIDIYIAKRRYSETGINNVRAFPYSITSTPIEVETIAVGQYVAAEYQIKTPNHSYSVEANAISNLEYCWVDIVKHY